MNRDHRGRQRQQIRAYGKIAGIASGVAGLMATAAVAIAGAAGPASAAPTATAAPGLTAVTAVSCATAARCWAGATDAKGAVIIATANGGASWHVQYATAKLSYMVAVDCASTERCVALGEKTGSLAPAFLATTNGGTAWSSHPAPKSLALPEALSCANGSDCLAVGLAGDRLHAAVARTTNGGRTWTSDAIPKLETAMSSSFGVSCPSSAHCLVTGAGTLTTANDGKTWTRHPNPGQAPLGPVTCPSVKDCYAAFNVTSAVPSNTAAFLYRSTNGGVSWRRVLAQPRHVVALTGISCPLTSACVSAGFGYTPRKNGNDTLYGLSLRTSTSGSHWTQTTVAKVQGLYAVSCVAKTRECVAGGYGGNRAVVLRSANDGATWTSAPLPRA